MTTKHHLTVLGDFKTNINGLIYKKVSVELPHLEKPLKLLVLKLAEGNKISYKVIEQFCPHQGYPLDKGKIMDIEDFGVKFGEAIKCPAHFWCFSLEDGQCDRSPHKLKIFETYLEGEDLYISI